jgi:peptidoglycan-N-acetylmuramic acid deacetylase
MMDETYKRVMDGLHNGAIILLHNVSSSNAEALPDIIDSILAKGYLIQSLDNLMP